MKIALRSFFAVALTLPWCAPNVRADQEVVFVANANGPVTVYSPLSAGAVAPVLTLADPSVPNTYWDPWGVAFDSQGNLYVQGFLSDATSFVYPPGGASPSRMFRAGGPDTRSIAVDASGYAYVATGEGPAQILVVPPGASGTGDSLYSVSPVRSIDTDETVWHPWPGILTTDTANHVIAAVVRAQGNAIETFDGGAAGSSSPIHEIAGPSTGLGACADTVCNTMAIAFAPATQHLWAAVSSGSQTHVSLFASGADGNAAPLRTIQGPATGLAGEVVTGVAESPLTGELFVLVKDSQFGASGQIEVFASDAQGDAAPVRSFTDASSAFANAAAIAIGSWATVDVPLTGHAIPARLVTRPNPSRGLLLVQLSLPQPVRRLRLQIFDPAGRSVATIWRGDALAGKVEASWDGRFATRVAPAGIYLMRASGEGLSLESRIVLLR